MYEIRQGQSVRVKDQARTKCACKRSGRDKVRVYEVMQGQQDQARTTRTDKDNQIRQGLPEQARTA